MRYLVLISLATILSSCGEVYVRPQLPILDPLKLPKINKKDLTCLKLKTYKAIVERDVRQAARIKRYEKIIRSTRK